MNEKNQPKWDITGIIDQIHKIHSVEDLLKLFLNIIMKTKGIEQAEIQIKTEEKIQKIIFHKKTMTIMNNQQFEFKNLQESLEIQNHNNLIQIYKKIEDSKFLIKIKKVEEFDSKHTDLLLKIIIFFIIQLNLVLKLEKYKHSSILDNITGIYNQKYVKHFVKNEIERGIRYQNKFSVIFFDLDHLREVNEKHGHLVASALLKEVALLLQNSIRKVDVVARFGGDEFLIILVNSDKENAFMVSKRLKKKIKSNRFLKNQGLRIRISGSFGISGFPNDGNDVNTLIEKADNAMYEVKKRGKDGVNVYKGDEE